MVKYKTLVLHICYIFNVFVLCYNVRKVLHMIQCGFTGRCY